MSSPYCIEKIKAIEVLDSRGYPTVQAFVYLQGGAVGVAAVPSGASVGKLEAMDLRDGGKRYCGKGVLSAVSNINKDINNLLSGQDAREQATLDNKMIVEEGTPNKSRWGANALLGVSLAMAKAVAQQQKIPLYTYIANISGSKVITTPIPMFNVINGGAHAANYLDIQEFMVQPVNAPSFSEALRWGTEIYHALGMELRDKGHNVAVGDEGGYAPNLKSNASALEILVSAIEMAGFSTIKDARLCLDCAASEFYEDGNYMLHGEGCILNSESFVDYLENLTAQFPIGSIEDGMAEDDWEGWKLLGDRLGYMTQLVGDDLFVTNLEIFNKGVDAGVANAILVKLNQIGTLTETLAVIERAHQVGYKVVISHRSGETEDSTIADLAVGVGANQIKAGAPCRSERVAKYNRLLTIENEEPDLIGYCGGISHILKV